MSKNWIHGVKICRRSQVISHMLFADDSYLFCRANMEEAGKVMEILGTFENATGQKVNKDKSSVFFSSNVIHFNRSRVCQTLSTREADSQSKILGVPNMLSRNKAAILGFLKEKVCNKIRSWANRSVSKAGQEVLINSVAQSLPAYAMSVFLLPQKVVQDIEKACQDIGEILL